LISYKHFNLYGHYNDKRISIHIYNDITKLIVNDDYIAIPFIYLYVDQFIRLQNTLSIPKVPFSEKKFCLFTSRNSLNDNKMKAIQELVKYGDVDSISNYPEITNKSCYHSKELLNVYSQYKFVMCFAAMYFVLFSFVSYYMFDISCQLFFNSFFLHFSINFACVF
jgi:hypothetical protein